MCLPVTPRTPRFPFFGILFAADERSESHTLNIFQMKLYIALMGHTLSFRSRKLAICANLDKIAIHQVRHTCERNFGSSTLWEGVFDLLVSKATLPSDLG